MAEKGKADRSGAVLVVVCPACKHRNEFPEFEEVVVFICSGCCEAVEVEQVIS